MLRDQLEILHLHPFPLLLKAWKAVMFEHGMFPDALIVWCCTVLQSFASFHWYMYEPDLMLGSGHLQVSGLG